MVERNFDKADPLFRIYNTDGTEEDIFFGDLMYEIYILSSWIITHK